MKEFKYHSTFATKRIRIAYPNEKSMALALASLEDLKGILPQGLDIENNPDLIFNSFNAAVVNRVNLNDDGIQTKAALEIANRFKHKFLDLEHNRKFVVGTVISHGYSEFLTNKALTEEQVKDMTKPFNITLGGVVWSIINPDFADQLVESSDETSPSYEVISASWEIGFNDYYIALGSRDLSEAEIITDPNQIKQFSSFLRASQGRGMTDDQVPVYRVITGEALPLGIGYTTTPAAEVKGVIVLKEDSLKEDEAQAMEEAVKGLAREQIELNTATPEKIEEKPKNEKNSSQGAAQDVNNNSIMKFKTLDDVTNEELFKDEAIAALARNFLGKFINDKIDEESSKYAEKLEAQKLEAAAKEEEAKKIQAQLEETVKQVEATREELKKEREVRAAEKAEADFQNRMADLDSQFNLGDKERGLIASDIKGLDDQAYATWFEKFETYAGSKKKAAKDDSEDAKNKESDPKWMDKKKNSAKASAEEVLDNASEKETDLPPNGAVVEVSMKDEYADAFGLDKFKIKK